MVVDIGGRETRGRAFDVLAAERASGLVVPSLSQHARKAAAASCGSLNPVDPANTVARLADTLRSQLAPPLLDALITELRNLAKP